MRHHFRTSRTIGFIALYLVYIIATLIIILVSRQFRWAGLFPQLFAADIAGTLFVWLMSIILNNSSVYDPYWSVAPIVLLLLGELHLGILNTGVFLMTGIILIWGIRLTAHWSTTFKSLQIQDWRYAQLRQVHPRLWPLINLFGIHLFPTLVVFFVLVPVFEFVLNFTFVNFGIVISMLISLFAVFLQHKSDTHMRLFRRDPANSGRVNRTGIWKYSRHPNYLGEILMWWGVYLMMFFSAPSLWLYIIGPLINTLMFVFISIPLMESRQIDNKPEYKDYKDRTGMLLPRLSNILKEKAEA